jgi:hypothetical protein
MESLECFYWGHFFIHVFGCEGTTMAEKKNWISGVIKKPGALRKELAVKGNKNIPEKKLKDAAKKGGKEGKRANLALTLKKLRKK